MAQLEQDFYENETYKFIVETVDTLKCRLYQKEERRPAAAVINLEETAYWAYIYEALYMPMLMSSGEQKWKHYRGVNRQLPTEEDLESL